MCKIVLRPLIKIFIIRIIISKVKITCPNQKYKIIKSIFLILLNIHQVNVILLCMIRIKMMIIYSNFKRLMNWMTELYTLANGKMD